MRLGIDLVTRAPQKQPQLMPFGGNLKFLNWNPHHFVSTHHTYRGACGIDQLVRSYVSKILGILTSYPYVVVADIYLLLLVMAILL